MHFTGTDMAAEDYHTDFYDPLETIDPSEEDYEIMAFNANLYRQKQQAIIEGQIKASDIMSNQFYVGHPRVFQDNWGHENIDAAVEHATRLTQETSQDHFVVQIVRLVRRKVAPVQVEIIPNPARPRRKTVRRGR